MKRLLDWWNDQYAWWKPSSWLEWMIAIAMLIAVGLIILAIVFSIKNEMNRIDEGTIIDKRYSGPYITYTQSGKVQIPIHHPESFHITITDGVKKYYTEVPEFVYKEYKVGDEIDLENY